MHRPNVACRLTNLVPDKGRHKIEERLARWLFLADDRLYNHEISLTHVFFGVMLGTANPGSFLRCSSLNVADDPLARHRYRH
jgi:hypothetical protein